MAETEFDVVIHGGKIADGSGGEPFVADVGLVGDRIAVVGDLSSRRGAKEIDASGLVVAPGFINVLSWATESLLEDGTSQSDIRQGVTLEVFGEGSSMGPLNDAMKAETIARQADIRFDVAWTSLGEYLDHLVARGVSTNVASFVGATTVRIHVLGYEDRAPAPEELRRMQDLVRAAMREGALGVGSSLIYAPAAYAGTDELVALCRTAGEYGGMYISHLRSEGNRFLEAIEELLSISRNAGVPAEIYHLKTAGRENWGKLDEAIALVENARQKGQRITADIYPYVAGATGLDAAMPPWVQEGGQDAFLTRLRDPRIRERVVHEIATPTDAWENLYLAAGGAQNVVLLAFRNAELKKLTGKTLAAVAADRQVSPEEAIVDLVLADKSRVGCAYFLMSEENLARKIALPWVSFGSDEASLAPEGVFLASNPHPRAYGTFARALGKYVRDQGTIPLGEAIRRMTALPAENFRLALRGRIQEGYYADLALFDPLNIQDHATFEDPHRYATGMVHVFVNGARVLDRGEHAGARPGRVVRGPGWRGER